ncbi:drebrin-like isoform X1 [Paramormyrops kingsleyae]|uniref:Drebrin n=1 Tax=Paramormyrops kingsleyae TaxID=1676925 RepID=A0A3B3T8H6_9TELE|nr:drebrin-like isoform X1 [Paramormyrops kingsleyae]XP_023675319.1 drebrin-like isoform X1 [Paramormyrops kingsleyae]
MAVNLSKNRLELLTAYQDVINDASPIDWALYTYEDNSNDLKLETLGDGGLLEISDTFDNMSVMYGFCSIKESVLAIPRYILINWVGDDVPDARKCACASHVATIADFFQGVDIVVNASSLEDIDPSAIEQRLTNGVTPATGPVLSHLRMGDEDRTDTVGTSYQKTNAEIEIKKISREEFWEQAQREEELRKEEERRKAAAERRRFEEERMESERREQEEREKRYRERERQIEELRRKLQSQEVDQPAVDRTRVVVTHEATQEKRESEVEEAAAIIAQRPENPREFFKQREKALACSFDSSPMSIHRKGRLDSPFLKMQYSLPEHSLPPVASHSHPHIRLHPALSESDDYQSSDYSIPMIHCPSIPKIVTTPIEEEENEDGALEEYGVSLTSEVAKAPPVQTYGNMAGVTVILSSDPEEHIFPDCGSPQQETGCLLHSWDEPEGLVSDQPSVAASPLSAELCILPEAPEGFSNVAADSVTFCDDLRDEDEPSSLVDIEGQHQMTLSYRHALEQASGCDSQDLDDAQLLMTNGDSLLKEGTQASEGYFSQSQEEEFAQADECSVKEIPAPFFYNKPPEIDITCWDTDPITEDEEYGMAE